jgi:hypothetical protein
MVLLCMGETEFRGFLDLRKKITFYLKQNAQRLSTPLDQVFFFYFQRTSENQILGSLEMVNNVVRI